MLRKNLFLISILTILSSSMFAQNYTFTFKVKGIDTDKKAYLANYFGDGTYYYDTTTVAEDGTFVFDRDTHTPGVFAVVFNGGKNFFEAILTENVVHMETDTSDLIANMVVKKSEENKAFFKYNNFLKKMSKKAAAYKGKTDDKSKAKLVKIDQKVRAYQAKMKSNNNDLFFGSFIGLAMQVKIPEDVQEDTIPNASYLYRKAHYWDNTEFSDSRIINSPLFGKKFNFYFDKMISPNADSIIKEAEEIIPAIDPKSELYKYVIHSLTHKYENHEQMGLDAVFVHFGLNYYYKKEDGTSPAFWLEDDKRAQVYDRAMELAPLRIGNVAPTLILPDTSGKNWVNIHKIEKDWTVLIFWEPSCGHCKKEVPKLKAVYDELTSRSDKGEDISLEVVSICTDLKTEAWKKYIVENELKWINISDNPELQQPESQRHVLVNGITTRESLLFRDTYDIFSTPIIYVLDKDKKIIAKRLSVQQLIGLLEHYLEIDIEYTPPADNKPIPGKPTPKH